MSELAIPHGSNTASNTPSTPVSAAPSDSVSATDATDVFWELADLNVKLYLVLGAAAQFINDTLKQIVADLRVRNSAQALALDSGVPPDEPPPAINAPFRFGGGIKEANEKDDRNKIALKRANDLLDYFHSFGIATEFPEGYSADPSVKATETTRRTVTVGQFNTWVNLLGNQIDRLKNDSSVEGTKGQGTMKSSSAAIESATTYIKDLMAMLNGVLKGIR
jgi:hypothetical protein